MIFGGHSAGAIGGMLYLDVVADMLEPNGVMVLGMLDSPLHIDFKLFDTSKKSKLKSF